MRKRLLQFLCHNFSNFDGGYTVRWLPSEVIHNVFKSCIWQLLHIKSVKNLSMFFMGWLGVSNGAGNLWPFRLWCEDRAAIHSSQQGQQPFCELEERVQRHFLAGGDYPFLPAGPAFKGVCDSGAMLHWAFEIGQAQTSFYQFLAWNSFVLFGVLVPAYH